ncbi:MAG: hypothetical protein MUO68_14155, partial [Desulfobacteraceae bacterium]|nr:hypothetical protein [Desulfobacteraceae bacterium]
NSYITVPIPTGLGDGRNLLVVRASDILVAVAGGYGTLSEMALALKADKPVIGLKTWKEIPGVQYADDYLEAIQLITTLLPLKDECPTSNAQRPTSNEKPMANFE